MWRVYKEAGRPWPRLSDDDVLDYMVMEAVAMKIQQQEAQQRKEQEAAQRKAEMMEKVKAAVHR